MNLIIDIGNTLVKYAVFDQNEIIDLRHDKEISINIIHTIVSKFPNITTVFISTVRKTDQHPSFILKDKIRLVEFTNHLKLPIVNCYETPNTLGKDRIAAAIGAAVINPYHNVLSIDTGTCITYDIVTKAGEYLGGSISPGIQMRFSALNTFTNNLPFIKSELEIEVDLIGKSTSGSILSGVQKAVLMEVDGMINEYREQFDELKIVVTGGDHKYFDKYLKNNIFASPNLVLIGLKKILDFNEDK